MVGVNIGTRQLKDCKVGSKQVKYIYVGSKLIWQAKSLPIFMIGHDTRGTLERYGFIIQYPTNLGSIITAAQNMILVNGKPYTSRTANINWYMTQNKIYHGRPNEFTMYLNVPMLPATTSDVITLDGKNIGGFRVDFRIKLSTSTASQTFTVQFTRPPRLILKDTSQLPALFNFFKAASGKQMSVEFLK